MMKSTEKLNEKDINDKDSKTNSTTQIKNLKTQLLWHFSANYHFTKRSILTHNNYENTPIQIYRKFHLHKLKIFR